MSEHPFYVGYHAKMDPALGSFTHKRILLAVVIGIVVAAAIGLTSKHFSRGLFEYGTTRTFTGVIVEEPSPMLAVLRPGQVEGGERFSFYHLVSPFKFGAGEHIDGLHGKTVQLEGTLIHNDEQTMIEIVPDSVRTSEDAGDTALPAAEAMGEHTFRGEIVDSKCYLGVMNPGNLKTHKSCAIRCISGGIPPVLLVRDEAGRAAYMLLVDEYGSSVNERVLDLVAEPIEVTGQLERVGTQLVLKADPAGYRRLP